MRGSIAMKHSLVIAEPINMAGVNMLTENGFSVIISKNIADEINKHANEVEVLILRLFPASKEIISRLPKLKIVGRYGAGYDSVDCDYAKERGVYVINAPGANVNAVAEYTLLAMLTVLKKFPFFLDLIPSGRFAARTQTEGLELEGKTLGIIGLGKIGREVARKAYYGFNMQICAFDPYVKEEETSQYVKLSHNLDDLLANSDILSIHAPLTQQTRNLIGLEQFGKMKRNSLLINVGRGGIVDEQALETALKEQLIGGAVLDVFGKEPVAADHPLLKYKNVLTTPHIAGVTQECTAKISTWLAQDIIAIYSGQKPENCVVHP